MKNQIDVKLIISYIFVACLLHLKHSKLVRQRVANTVRLAIFDTVSKSDILKIVGKLIYLN